MNKYKRFIKKYPLLLLGIIFLIFGVLLLIYDKTSYILNIYSIGTMGVALIVNILISKKWKDNKISRIINIYYILIISIILGNALHMMTYSGWFPMFYQKLNNLSSSFYTIGALALIAFLLMVASILSTTWNKIGALVDTLVIGIMTGYAIRFTLFPLVFESQTNIWFLTISILIYLFSFVTMLVIVHYSKGNEAKKFSNILYFGFWIWIFSSSILWWIFYKNMTTAFLTLNTLWSISYLFIAIGLYYSKINISQKVELRSNLNREEKSLPLVIVLLLGGIIFTNPSLLEVSFFIGLILFRFYIHRYIFIYKENEEIIYEYKLANLELESKIEEINNLNKTLERRVNLRKNSLETKNRELYKLANIDQLTNIPNRRRFKNFIEDLINKNLILAEKKDFAVLFIDLDQFKVINDTYGHDVGDKILIQTAERIRNTVDHKDFIARLGGDEFVVIINNYKNLKELEKKALQIVEEFQSPFKYENYGISSTISIGISTFPEDGITPRDLMRFADIALYHSKNTGKNRASLYSMEMSK